MNQFNDVFIRGENALMMGKVWNLMTQIEALSNKLTSTAPKASQEKLAYHKAVLIDHQKPAWYNMFDRSVTDCLASDIFRQIFGYNEFRSYIVGFKEIRFWNLKGLSSPTANRRGVYMTLNQSSYEDFRLFLDFHEQLCEDTKFVFNYRRNYNYTTGQGFYKGIEKAEQLRKRITWLKQYQKDHFSNAITVYYEDMFNPMVNQTVFQCIANFIKKPLPINATFARVPTT